VRALATAARVREFMRRLGPCASADTRVYLTGGATAVLIGWRETTVDVDLKMAPESDPLFQAIPRLKEELDLNVKLACPTDFIPPIPGWESRSPFIVREGKIDWRHFDPYAQVLSKIERGHDRDGQDAREMARRGLVVPAQVKSCFDRIRPDLVRHPAIDPDSFARRVDEWVRGV
jgi:hypothetical protein